MRPHWSLTFLKQITHGFRISACRFMRPHWSWDLDMRLDVVFPISACRFMRPHWSLLQLSFRVLLPWNFRMQIHAAPLKPDKFLALCLFVVISACRFMRPHWSQLLCRHCNWKKNISACRFMRPHWSTRALRCHAMSNDFRMQIHAAPLKQTILDRYSLYPW